MHTNTTLLVLACAVLLSFASTAGVRAEPQTNYVIRPAALFDGKSSKLQRGWAVVVRGERIEADG